jgi:hypothetical protein
MCNIQTIVGATESTIDLLKGEGTLKDVGEAIIEGELGPMLDMLEGVGKLFGNESEGSASETKSGDQATSMNLGEGPININISANASATAGAADESSAVSVSGDQSTKDMEGTQADYGAGSAGGSTEEGVTGEDGAADDPINSEIEGMKEGIADGLMAIEEFEPGFIDDVMGQVEASANADAKSNAGTADSTQGGDATQGEDTAQDAGGADTGEAIGGGNEELLASLEELAVMLEELIGQLGGGEAEKPGAEQSGSEPDKAAASNKESVSSPNTGEVAEGMADELGDGKAPEAAQSSPVDTFMEIFDQMSPDAQNEVVEILASGAFGEDGLEAADAVKDDATGDIDAGYALDEAEAA